MAARRRIWYANKMNSIRRAKKQNVIEEESYIVRLRGLPYSTRSEDVLDFLRGCFVVGGINGIHHTNQGLHDNRRTMFARLGTSHDLKYALSLNMTKWNGQLIQVDRAKEIHITPRPKAPNKVILLRGFSWGSTEQDVINFMDGIKVRKRKMQMSYDKDFRTSGDCIITLNSNEDVQKALQKHMHPQSTLNSNGRFIEVYESSHLAFYNLQKSMKQLFSERDSSSVRQRNEENEISGYRSPYNRSPDRSDLDYPELSRSRSADHLSDIFHSNNKRIRYDSPDRDSLHRLIDRDEYNRRDIETRRSRGSDYDQFEWNTVPIGNNQMNSGTNEENDNFMVSITDEKKAKMSRKQLRKYWPIEQHLLRRLVVEGDQENIARFEKKYGRPLNKIGDDNWMNFLEIKVHIVHENYPNHQLNDYEIEQLCTNICNRILRMPGKSLYPRFNRCLPFRGGLFVVCSDSTTYIWLRKIMDDLRLADGSRCRVIRGRNDQGQIKMMATIPCCLPLDPKKVCQALMVQNTALYTGNWTVIDRKMNKDGQTFVWSGPPGAFKSLEKYNFTAFLGLNTIKFRKVTNIPDGEPIHILESGSDFGE